MNWVSSRLGLVRPCVDRLAAAYDLATGESTANDRSWRLFFQGRRALSPKKLEKLSAAFPGIPVQRMYREGPGGLWQALWGELEEFREGVLADDMASFDDTASLSNFSSALYAFERSVLRAVAADDQPVLNVSHLARAVAFRRVLSLFRLETDGMDFVISICMENFFIYAELVSLDVQVEVSDQIDLVIQRSKPGDFQGRIEHLAWNKALDREEGHWLIAQHQAVDSRLAWNWRGRRAELSLAFS